MKTTNLETTKISLIYEVEEINYLNDYMLILTRNKVLAFDFEGNFLFNVGNVGNGPGEYLNISSFFVKNNSIYLVDGAKRTVLTYNKDGVFSYSTPIPDEPNNAPSVAKIFPVSDGLFVARNRFRGDNQVTPTLSILDSNYKIIKYVNGRNMKSGILTMKNLFYFKNEVLYWELLNDTIFSIVNNEKINPKYHVDFNKYVIPEYVMRSKNFLEVLQWANNPDNISKTASLVAYVQEDEQYVRFIFSFNRNQHYVRYNKSSGKAKVFRLVDSSMKIKVSSFMDYRNGYLTFAATYIDEIGNNMNPILLKINESEINSLL